MVPVRWTGGQERREGLPSGWRLGNCGAREAAVAPEFPGTPQIKHTDTEQHARTQRENGKAEERWGKEAAWGSNYHCTEVRAGFLQFLKTYKGSRFTGSHSWPGVGEGKGKEITGEWGDGVMIVAREV